MTATPQSKSQPQPRSRRFFGIGVGVTFFVLLIGLRVFVIEAFKIPSGAMLPTIQVGDHIYVNKMVYRFGSPQRGEVIVFRYPEDPRMDFIKRVVAIGGDTVEIRQNLLYINGTPVARQRVGPIQYDDISQESDPPRVETRQADQLQETLDGHPYSIYLDPGSRSGGCPRPARYGCGQPVRVPAGTVYVMGDNRDNSNDSRFWGFVPNDLVKGRAMFVWYSSALGEVRWRRIGHRIR